jgi:uncharacterized protein with HEPN domain
MKRNNLIYIKDIMENMENVEKFSENINYEEFIKDKKINYAVVRCIEIIGEAAKQVSEEIRSKYPHVPWKEMAGMRDKVIHFYFGVNLEKVWLVVTRDIPKLKPEIQKILNEITTP